jgi:Tol biopolymer transport system component
VGFSPDGSRLAFLRSKPETPVRAEQVALLVSDRRGQHVRRLTPWDLLLPDTLAGANWSPDGRDLVSATTAGQLVVVHADGSGSRRLHLHLAARNAFAFMPDYAPDGRRLVFSAFVDTAVHLYRADISGGHVRRLTDSGRNDLAADWGPVRHGH